MEEPDDAEAEFDQFRKDKLDKLIDAMTRAYPEHMLDLVGSHLSQTYLKGAQSLAWQYMESDLHLVYKICEDFRVRKCDELIRGTPVRAVAQGAAVPPPQGAAHLLRRHPALRRPETPRLRRRHRADGDVQLSHEIRGEIKRYNMKMRTDTAHEDAAHDDPFITTNFCGIEGNNSKVASHAKGASIEKLSMDNGLIKLSADRLATDCQRMRSESYCKAVVNDNNAQLAEQVDKLSEQPIHHGEARTARRTADGRGREDQRARATADGRAQARHPEFAEQGHKDGDAQHASNLSMRQIGRRFFDDLLVGKDEESPSCLRRTGCARWRR